MGISISKQDTQRFSGMGDQLNGDFGVVAAKMTIAANALTSNSWHDYHIDNHEISQRKYRISEEKP